jgi:hypothetical protein
LPILSLELFSQLSPLPEAPKPYPLGQSSFSALIRLNFSKVTTVSSICKVLGEELQADNSSGFDLVLKLRMKKRD